MDYETFPSQELMNSQLTLSVSTFVASKPYTEPWPNHLGTLLETGRENVRYELKS